MTPTACSPHTSISTRTISARAVRSFAVVYLMAHGAVKRAAAWTLLIGRRPTTGSALGALGVLAAAELWRAADTRSIVVLAAAALDMTIIIVIGRNYRRLRRHSAEDGARSWSRKRTTKAMPKRGRRRAP